MKHKYQEDDIITCLKDRRIVFIGDSATRHIFWATAKKLGFQEQAEDQHADFALRRKGVTVEFAWDPYLNSSGLRRETMAVSLSTEDERIADTAAILLIGGGLWHARYLEEMYMPHFKESVQAIYQDFKTQDEPSTGYSAGGLRYSALNLNCMMLIAPVPVPVYRSLTTSRANTMTMDRIDSMNSYLRQVSLGRAWPVVWSYVDMTTKQKEAYQPDGLHVIHEVATNMADILLNLRCNAVLRRAQTKKYPMDKTCCNSYNIPSWTQATILIVSMVVIPLLALVTSQDFSRLSFLPPRRIARAIMILSLAISYCYFADRTSLFTKAQKQYQAAEFTLLCSIVVSLGILSVRRSGIIMPLSPNPANLGPRDEPFLSRQQTDEWKGWMQCIILIYHYTGASKVLWIYEIIRLLVASYLFLSGFGHTVFFYQKADYSYRRCAVVLIRLNMLSCILPYVMDTDYIFYYFAPLISFWYLVIHTTMVIGHSNNHSLKFLTGKIATSAIVVTALIEVPRTLELLFRSLEHMCNIKWDVKEWRFRLQLDSYIVYTGMLCAILFIRINESLRLDGAGKSTFDRLVQRYFHCAKIVSLAISITSLPTFFVLASRVTSKQEYNSWVPYVSTVPILSFIIIRNFSRNARNFHSTIFAWVGRHSLETFLLQYHIWLAADTRGRLALGLVEKANGGAEVGRRVEMLVLTIIFLWVCWHVAAATQNLTGWLIDPRAGRDESADNEGIAVEGERITRTRSYDDTERFATRRRLADKVTAGAIRSAGIVTRMLAKDLRVRLAIIVGIMWVVNIMSN